MPALGGIITGLGRERQDLILPKNIPFKKKLLTPIFGLIP